MENFKDKHEQHWLEGQRGLLHSQLEQLTGQPVTAAVAQQLAARSR
jgi:hypothetical protein